MVNPKISHLALSVGSMLINLSTGFSLHLVVSLNLQFQIVDTFSEFLPSFLDFRYQSLGQDGSDLTGPPSKSWG